MCGTMRLAYALVTTRHSLHFDSSPWNCSGRPKVLVSMSLSRNPAVGPGGCADGAAAACCCCNCWVTASNCCSNCAIFASMAPNLNCM